MFGLKKKSTASAPHEQNLTPGEVLVLSAYSRLKETRPIDQIKEIERRIGKPRFDNDPAVYAKKWVDESIKVGNEWNRKNLMGKL